ncbi:MAG: hypothetical protein J6P07_07330, partial [Spirochaetaceae bacterium]|nr:hypothetical protein [Spirochaetaceae bacterium]
RIETTFHKSQMISIRLSPTQSPLQKKRRKEFFTPPYLQEGAGITHGVNGKVVVMGFDCNKWALRELLAGNWNYDGQCSPFQAAVIENMIKTGKVPSKKVISEEKGFDAKKLTQADIDKYGLGD